MKQNIHPNGAPNIQFSGANSTFKPSKEDIKHEKQFAEVWEQL